MILLFCALVGATLILVRGTIFEPLQRRFSLFRCAQCTGFWVGVAAGASELMTTGHGHVVDAMIIGMATSFFALSADAVFVHLLGEKS